MIKTDKFIPLKKKFNSRSHARQELDKMKEKGIISNYRIAWNTQLRMTVHVVYTNLVNGLSGTTQTGANDVVNTGMENDNF